MSSDKSVFVVSLSETKCDTAVMAEGGQPDYTDEADISVTYRGDPDDDERIAAVERYIAYVIAEETERGR